MKILVTCPPMLGMKEQFVPIIESEGHEVFCPDVTQTLSEEELIEILPEYDGWIIGDDPATDRVIRAGAAGNLKAAVKWGIGIDNVNFDTFNELGLPITNTPNMFGAEVADVGIGYLIALARETFFIDRKIRQGEWPKNSGISISSKVLGLIGYGDIGRSVAHRATALGMDIIVYDPGVEEIDSQHGIKSDWPKNIEKCDFLLFTCALNKHNHHMLNDHVFNMCKPGVRIINVARGPLINEADLITNLKSEKVHSAALDVFEVEPLPMSSELREHELCIFGSHNSSNTKDAVMKTNKIAISKLFEFLEAS